MLYRKLRKQKTGKSRRTAADTISPTREREERPLFSQGCTEGVFQTPVEVKRGQHTWPPSATGQHVVFWLVHLPAGARGPINHRSSISSIPTSLRHRFLSESLSTTMGYAEVLGSGGRQKQTQQPRDGFFGVESTCDQGSLVQQLDTCLFGKNC